LRAAAIGRLGGCRDAADGCKTCQLREERSPA
jgi:hypothetical protein